MSDVGESLCSSNNGSRPIIMNDASSVGSLLLSKPKSLSLPTICTRLADQTHHRTNGYGDAANKVDFDWSAECQTNKPISKNDLQRQNLVYTTNSNIMIDSPEHEVKDSVSFRINEMQPTYVRPINETSQDLNFSIMHSREGKTIVQMKNEMDRLLDDMCSIEIRNAILMDRLVMLGSDL